MSSSTLAHTIEDLDSVKTRLEAAGWSAPDLQSCALVLLAYRLDLIDDRLKLTARSVEYISDNIPGNS